MRFVTFGVGQALLARVLFLGHSLLAVGHTANALGDALWWLLAIANVALLVETVFIVIKRKGEEWRWICPSAVCYLCATVPSICLLELDKLDRQFNSMKNTTAPAGRTNLTRDASQAPTSPIDWVEDLFQSSIKLSPDLWVEVIEQMLLLLLIIGRWVMPKGKISRDELSQLLFVYIAIASDIMELFELFEEEKVYRNTALRYSIMGVWSVSLFQFTLVLTASRNPKKARPVAATGDNNRATHDQVSASGEKTVKCFGEEWVEILSLSSSLLMMDGPFFAIRLYVLVALDLLTYNIIFFTSKNLLMVLLTLYRFFVIVNNMRKEKKDDNVSDFNSLKDSAGVDNGICGMDLSLDVVLVGETTDEDGKSNGISMEKIDKILSDEMSIKKENRISDYSHTSSDYVMFEAEDSTKDVNQELTEEHEEGHETEEHGLQRKTSMVLEYDQGSGSREMLTYPTRMDELESSAAPDIKFNTSEQQYANGGMADNDCFTAL